MKRKPFILASAALTIAASALFSNPFTASAATASGVRHVSYVAAFTPLFRGGYPYTGDLHLTYNNGIISGTYRGTSIRPDPLNNRISQVSGGVSGDNIHFGIGQGFSFQGTLDRGTIAGSATWRGRRYRFEAKATHGVRKH